MDFTQNWGLTHVIGKLVAKYFPEVAALELGTDAENRVILGPLEAFLHILSTNYDLVEELQERAVQLASEDPDGEWRISM